MNHYLRRFITRPRHTATFLYQNALMTEFFGLLSVDPSLFSCKFLEFQAFSGNTFSIVAFQFFLVLQFKEVAAYDE